MSASPTLVYEQIASMDAVSIVTVLARELSADPNAQTEICTELSSHIPTNVSDSGQEALTSQMIALLTEPCQLEIVGVQIGRAHV